MRRSVALGSVATILLGLAVLYRFPPEATSWFPQCPIHALTGLLCPGCGATRALAALLHGRFREALRRNSLFTALLPFFVLYGIAAFRRAFGPQRYAWPRVPTTALYALLAMSAIFTLVRNLV